MSSFQWRAKVLASTVLAGVMWAAPAAAQQPAAPPDFSSSQFGWVRVGQGGPDFDAVPGQVPPVANDPGHPFVNNGGARQPTYRIADLTNPILQPWAADCCDSRRPAPPRANASLAAFVGIAGLALALFRRRRLRQRRRG